MSAKIQTSWMWQNEITNGVMGAIVDTDDLTIQWFDEPGCACTDSHAVQSIQDFLANGSHFIKPPADVAAEMHENLSQLVQNTPE